MLHYRFIIVLYRRIIWYNERFPHVLQRRLLHQPQQGGAWKRLKGRVRIRRGFIYNGEDLIRASDSDIRQDGNYDSISDNGNHRGDSTDDDDIIYKIRDICGINNHNNNCNNNNSDKVNDNNDNNRNNYNFTTTTTTTNKHNGDIITAVPSKD